MTEGTDTPTTKPGDQRTLELRIAITGGPDHLTAYDAAAIVAEGTFRIPDDVDLATIDQIGAKITKATAGIVDAGIVNGGALTRIDELLATLRTKAGAPITETGDGEVTEQREFAEV